MIIFAVKKNTENQQQTFLFPESKVLEVLKKREVPEEGICFLSSRNGKQVPVLLLRKGQAETTSPSSKTQLNTQIKSALAAQGPFQKRTEEFLQDREISKMAASTLSLAGAFNAKATVDLKIRGKFTNEQLNILRQAGMKLASPEDIRQEEADRQIPMKHQMLWLQAAEKNNEETKVIEVRFKAKNARKKERKKERKTKQNRGKPT